MSTALLARPVDQPYQQIITRYDEEQKIAWCLWSPTDRPCFTTAVLHDIHRFQIGIEAQVRRELMEHGESSIDYVVFGSNLPSVYSFGGDLSLFVECIRAGDRAALERYMRVCCNPISWVLTQDLPVTSIALVQGIAFGAGFEAALGCDVIIAERGAELGFPEALFNMFPGMGGYNLLARALGVRRAERMLLEARTHPAPELKELGLIDVVAEEGCGEAAVFDYARKHRRTQNAQRALARARRCVSPVTREELWQVAEVWLDAAMRLTERELKTMERLVRAQVKKFQAPAGDTAQSGELKQAAAS
ncbi:MAG: enoyl-CoA hydratase [Gammaproteobacteria bacterium]|nr:enoyl-CoA hydratase [Gammaproteobacteria bacterium]NIR85350.1 enoyl-CoA hydratase [Gammaproteobacteria bacterium]NIR88810.1 enoyl-CoA hydratase [Gammaproteobacteria bacterium]NIT68542.1 enoyl-CoA hydratase [Gemmatimonadota bacterium]NIY37119.1 enoyl-CoA hydratase [Gemmatimonadota bacterium]